MKKIKLISLFVTIAILISVLASCNVTDTDTQAESTAAASNSEARLINGVPLEEYTVIYSDEDVDYSKRAAEYISEQIKARTSVQLAVKEDDEGVLNTK